MNALEKLNVQRNLALIGRTRSEVYFAYTASGYDHAPFLLIDANPIAPPTIMELNRKSFSKKILRGKIIRNDEGTYCFVLSSETTDQDVISFVSDISDGFVEQLPFLARSKVNKEQ